MGTIKKTLTKNKKTRSSYESHLRPHHRGRGLAMVSLGWWRADDGAPLLCSVWCRHHGPETRGPGWPHTGIMRNKKKTRMSRGPHRQQTVCIEMNQVQPQNIFFHCIVYSCSLCMFPKRAFQKTLCYFTLSPDFKVQRQIKKESTYTLSTRAQFRFPVRHGAGWSHQVLKIRGGRKEEGEGANCKKCEFHTAFCCRF